MIAGVRFIIFVLFKNSGMALLSVVIITLNEERNIGRCLDSLTGIADEIVVVDSLSTDRTRSICEARGVRFIEQPFLGYLEQKNFALDAASHAYVLSLDADEALSPVLAAAILEQKARDFPAQGYTMNRLNWFCDRWIRHGTWYPDRKLRLVRRDAARWGVTNPHERLILQEGYTSYHLDGDLLHYTYYSLDEFIRQGNTFSTMAAHELHAQGRKASWWNILWNPLFAFLKSYIFKAGFLDGFYGYIIARQSASQTLFKYAKLRMLQKQ